MQKFSEKNAFFFNLYRAMVQVALNFAPVNLKEIQLCG